LDMARKRPLKLMPGSTAAKVSASDGDVGRDRLFALRELTEAAARLPAVALVGVVDEVRDLLGPKCRAALLAEIAALCHGIPTHQLVGMRDELRKLVGLRDCSHGDPAG